MSWNKPSSVPQPPPKKSAPPSLKRGLFAGLLVVALGALCYFMFRPSAATPKRDSAKDRGLIKEVTPAAAPKAKPEKPKDPPGYWNGKKITNENRPPWMNPYHRVVDYGKIHTNRINEATRPLEEKIFHNGADIQIARALKVQPGAAFIGNLDDFYEGFNEDFRESLKEPIIVTHDDPEEVKELKRAVNEVKADFKARMDAGEDLQKLMEQNWKDMKELGLYKEELSEQVAELCEDKTVTEQDMRDYVAAANKMLRDRGCTELRAESFMRTRFRLEAERRLREKGVTTKTNEEVQQ